MTPIRALRREFGLRRQSLKEGKSLAAVRQQRDAQDRLVARDAAALGASRKDMLLAHSPWLDGTISIRSKFGRLHLRPKDTDLLVIRQVLVGGEYDFDKLEQMGRIKAAYDAMLSRGETPVIIDAGANIGMASRWFALRFPQAQVIGVEPDPGNAAVARLNAAEVGNVQVVEAAIGAARGKVKLETFDNQGWGARTERSDAGIDLVTINDLISSVSSGQLLIAKVDIEGFEADLFSANIEWVDQAVAVIIEPHDWMLPGAGTSQTFQSALLNKGRELLISGENLVFV